MEKKRRKIEGRQKTENGRKKNYKISRGFLIF